jgi:dihydroxyacetone kinase-like protein
VKKLINETNRIVDDMIDGFVAAYPDQVRRGDNSRVVRRAAPRSTGDKVSILIGNGSGHEPIAMGFVGEGLLDANVVGDVFAAPSPELILDGLREVTGPAGSILLISQHSGDVINGNAAVAMALDEGLKVAPLLMYDDISSASKDRESERRGAPGTIFIYKILGAAAEVGMDLETLVRLGEDVRGRTRTLAAAVGPGVSPVSGKPMFELPPDEIFIGMGVHGEPGMGRMKTGPVRELVSHMVARLLEDGPMPEGDEVVVFVNGPGGTSLMELLIVFREVNLQLQRRGFRVVAPLVHELVTTQEMAGVSISLLSPTAEMLRLWRAPSAAPYFPGVGNSRPLGGGA